MHTGQLVWASVHMYAHVLVSEHGDELLCVLMCTCTYVHMSLCVHAHEWKAWLGNSSLPLPGLSPCSLGP